MFFWSVLVLLLLATLTLWLGRLRMQADFRHGNAGDELSLCVHILGCRVYRRHTVLGEPSADARERVGAEGALTRLRVFCGRILAEFPQWERILRPVVFRELVWTTTIGTGDPPLTAVLCGGAWSVKSALLGAASQILHFAKAPKVSVQPRFDGPVFQSDVRCIVVARLGQATYAGWRLFLLLKRS